jgi:hypothetical protein
MPGGTLALLRNLGGMAGIGLLSAAIIGGAFGWTGPMAYLLITEGALAHRSVTPWVWPTRRRTTAAARSAPAWRSRTRRSLTTGNAHPYSAMSGQYDRQACYHALSRTA